jgi:hypothetical protein
MDLATIAILILIVLLVITFALLLAVLAANVGLRNDNWDLRAQLANDNWDLRAQLVEVTEERDYAIEALEALARKATER